MKTKTLPLILMALILSASVMGQFAGTGFEAQKATTDVAYILSWDVAPTANTPAYRQEHYSVWISTTGNTPDDFTTMLFEETLSTTHTNWVYQTRQVNIDDYAGLTVWVAIRHHDVTDMDRIVIDNVKLFRTDGKNATTEIVYLFEDFQAGIGNPAGEDWLPDGWTAVDADGDGYNWYFGVRQNEAAMRSQSWDTNPLTPNNYLITPGVLLGTVGIHDPVKVQVSIFPNPATSQITIKSESRIFEAELLNLVGSRIIANRVDAYQLTLDLSNQVQGLYFLRLHTDNGIVTRKVNIKK